MRRAKQKEFFSDPSSRRVSFLSFFIIAIFLMIVFRLYFLQIISADSFKALAGNQHSAFQKLFPTRGEIYLQDKDGFFPAAVNKESRLLYAVPRDIEDPEAVADFLESELGIKKEDIIDKLYKKNDVYEVIKHRLSEEEIAKVKARDIKGLELLPELYRYYPGVELASNVLGFVGWKGDSLIGRYGLEAYFEKELKGEEGNIFQERDAAGRWITTGVRNIKEAQDGEVLILTIDHIVQFEIERVLKGAVKKFEAEAGSIVVMDPNNGKILALASYPNFNPNEYSKVEDIAAFRNLSVSSPYESGSVFKTFTIAAALDSGKITPETTYTDTGSVYEAGYRIQNSDYKSYGLQTMTQVLEKSLNTGVIFVEKLLGNKNFSDYIKRFGFGELTGIETIGENAGDIRNLNNLKSDIQFFTASFGQGITVTPIQLAAAYSAIANGGTLMKPQIIDQVIKSDGVIEEVSSKDVRRVISAKASREALEMLVSVVDNGHGKRAGVPGYFVGGKTGTAQVASTQEKGYEEGKSIGSFAGIAPADNPRFVVVIRIDDPKSVEWAESSAAPACGEIMKFLLEYYNIEPAREYTQNDLDQFAISHNLREYSMQEDEKEREDEEKDNNIKIKEENT